MENFTPFSALAGGVFIGLGASVLWIFNGRIAGISGIAAGLLRPKTGEWLWRFFFVSGIVAGAALILELRPETLVPRVNYPLGLLIAGGLLVGIGTRMGSGCTSGHGVCGIARLSLRSIVATLVFMAAGGVTVFILRHLVGVN